MFFNTHLLRSLVSRGSLLGAYWAIVLVISFRVHAGSKLGEMEMMKRVGGQSGPYGCSTYTDNSCCTDKGCPASCPEDYLYQDCLVQYQPFQGPTAQSTDGYCPEQCSTAAGPPTCTAGNLQQVNCNAFYDCGCEPDEYGPICNPAPEPQSYECYQMDVGTASGSVQCQSTPCGKKQ